MMYKMNILALLFTFYSGWSLNNRKLINNRFSCHRDVSITKTSFSQHFPPRNFLKLEATSIPTSSSDNRNSKLQTWRIYNVDVLYENDPGKDNVSSHEQLIQSVIQTLPKLKGSNSWKPNSER